MTERSQLEPARYARRRLRESCGGGSGHGLLSATLVTLALVVASAVAGRLRAPIPPPELEDGDAVVTADGSFFLLEEGVAYPLPNRASALLLADRVVPVSLHDLSGLARGRPRGIPGAVSALPAPSALIDTGWQLCTDGPTALHLAFGAAPYLSPADDDTTLLTDGAAYWSISGGARAAASPSPGAIPTIPELIGLLPTGAATSGAVPVSGGSVVCAQSEPTAPFARPGAAAVERAAHTTTAVTVSTPRASVAVSMPSGSGVLVPQSDGQGYWLLSSSAELAPVADDAALSRLGYRPEQATDVPECLMLLLPAGPELSIDSAR